MSDLTSDLARYGRHPLLREQSAWSVAIYRFGRRMLDLQPGPKRAVGLRCYWTAYRVIQTLTSITLPIEAVIGPGLRIWHFGGIVIHEGVRAGSNLTLRHGVTIGERVEGGPVPVLGDDVDVGVYAQILGGITIGHGARIGAMSLVLQDVPAGATAVGIPARIVSGSGGAAGTGSS